MAVGMDNKLRSQNNSAYSAPRVSDKAVANYGNNMMAMHHGTGRATQQSMGGRGMSAGRGQEARGQRAEDQAKVKGYTAAAQNAMQAASSNASMALATEQMRDMEKLGYQGLLNGLSDQRQQAMLANKSRAADMYSAANQHRLGMDSIYLDTNPLLASLLR